MAKARNNYEGKRIADRYCTTGQIGKGGMGVVYKAIPFDDPSHAVAIKVIQRSGRLGYDDLMRFQKEASLMSQLHHPNIVVFHELGLFTDEESEGNGLGAGYYIVMEIADGDDLKESLARDGRKDLAYFFQIGLQVSRALDYTHGKNIIHRDIKPQNIIVGKAWRDQSGVLVKVLDFGVARLAEAMHYSGGARESGRSVIDDAAGTPLYMAPEQTQLMNAPIDHRMDLYSLGCVLYEILAGKPPFTARSRAKLEKAHVFSEPDRLTNVRPDIPKVVEDIVHKLLAKHPDDRYQTAFALHADLTRAKSLFDKAANPQGISFPLGLKDSFQAVSAQLKLEGRREEVKHLMDAYEAVVVEKGRSRLSLIKGSAGIGKTRLMNEVRANLQAKKVKYVSGSFSQHENALPFNALANAFNEYLHRILKSHPHEAEELRKRIKTTIGDMAYNIAEIVPGLKPFLYERLEEDGNEFEPWDLMNNEEHLNRFAKVFSDFTRCLGTNNQAVVFLFDDLHWADDKSLQLIDTFFTNANTLQFYLVISERTGLAVPNARFEAFKEKFTKLRRRYLEIELEALDEKYTRRVVGNMLSSADTVDDRLSIHMFEATTGNPMHIVELTRTLVAQDLIFKDTRKGSSWKYNMESLRKTQIRLNTIDLILSRIQSFQEFDRKILEIAAVVGMTFQFEILLVAGRSQSVLVMKAIQKAMEEGLIIRGTDDPDLKHLGKTYHFAHKKARDAIYEAIDPQELRRVHFDVATKLQSAVPNPSEKVLFALAHHYNSAYDGTNRDNLELAKDTLRYNGKAGKAAKKNGSWHTAERYYENCAVIMKKWRHEVANNVQHAAVVEILADLAAIQKKHGAALKSYTKLLGHKLPIEMHASIAHKAINYMLVGGMMSDANRLTRKTLRFMRRNVPNANFWAKLNALASLFVDVLPKDRKNQRLHKLLSRAHSLRKYDRSELDKKTPAIRLYSTGYTINLHDNPWLAVDYHSHAFKSALRGRGSPESIVSVVIQRAAILGYLGFFRLSYGYFELCMDVAKACNLRAVYGHAALQRVLVLEYVRGRSEEVGDHLKDAMHYLTPQNDRVGYASAVCFNIFRELIRCNFGAVDNLRFRMPDTVPTRNWLHPRSMAMMLYGYLMQGSRANIVRHGESFLKRRREKGGREDDQFILIIQTMINFARGETDKTRDTFIRSLYKFILGNKVEFLYPHEEDFVGLFALTFPVMFEQEYGRQLMRTAEMKALLERLRVRVSHIKGQNRDIPLLLVARANDLLGRKRNLKNQYDAALKAARYSNNQLVQTFAYTWFGQVLLQSGSDKLDYIRRAHSISNKYRMKALSNYTRKTLESYGVVMEDNSLTTGSSTKTVTDSIVAPSPLFIQNLRHICKSLDSETKLEMDLRESFDILFKHYAADRFVVVLSSLDGEAGKIILPADTKDKQLVDYVSPYVNIKSTLQLPSSSAPWIEGPETEGSVSDYGSSSYINDGPQEDNEATIVMEGGSNTALDQTEALGGNEFDGFEAEHSAPTHQEDDSTTYRSNTLLTEGQPSAARGAGLSMSAIVPMRSDFDSLGVIYLENIKSLHHRDSTLTRQELDQFGAQIGLAIDRKINGEIEKAEHPDLVPAIKSTYKPASYTIEQPDWIRIWSKGKLRVQRETTWYLGLQLGPDHYIMAYCSLAGEERVRERFSSMIWHHLHTYRAQAIASGRSLIDIGDIRDELNGLLGGVPKAGVLERIALSFTLFDRKNEIAHSGHYGSARPLVVGVENVVTPYNEVLLQYANGRDLRYWEVAAALSEPHAYVLSYDTSKIDTAADRTLGKRVEMMVKEGDSSDELHQALCTLVAEEHLPRYYVSAMLAPQKVVKSQDSANSVPKLDKGA